MDDGAKETIAVRSVAQPFARSDGPVTLDDLREFATGLRRL